MKFPFHVRLVSVAEWSKALDLELRPVPTDVTCIVLYSTKFSNASRWIFLPVFPSTDQYVLLCAKAVWETKM